MNTEINEIIKKYAEYCDKCVIKEIQEFLGTEENDPFVLKEILDELGFCVRISFTVPEAIKEGSTIKFTSQPPVVKILPKEVNNGSICDTP